MTGYIVALFTILYRIPLINFLGDKGVGYYSISYEIYLLLASLLAYALPQTVCNLLKVKLEKNEYRQAYRVFDSCIKALLISSSLIAVALVLFSKILASYALKADFTMYSIWIIAPCIIFACMSGVMRGFFMAFKPDYKHNIPAYVQELVTIVTSLIFTFLFTKLGSNLSISKGNSLYESAFSAMGAMLGIMTGLMISLIFMYSLYIICRKSFKKQIHRDHSRAYKTSKRKTLKQLIILMTPVTLIPTFYYLSNISDYVIFNRIMSVQGMLEGNYMILLGMFNGKYDFFISLPMLFANWMASSRIKELTNIAHSGNKRQMHTLMSKCLRYTIIGIIPCIISYIVFAKPLMDMLFITPNDTAAVMLRIGAISALFYSLAALSNAALSALDDWATAAKNVIYATVIHIIVLLAMMIIFQWGIYAVVASRIVFAASICILNEHSLRERIGFIKEQKRTFTIPLLAGLSMLIVSMIVYFAFRIIFGNLVGAFFSLIISLVVYLSILIYLGGISSREMYQLPFGKHLAPLCKKLHLLR